MKHGSRVIGRPIAKLIAAIAGVPGGVAAMTLQEATHIAHGLIEGYIGHDHRVVDMRRFFGALVDASDQGIRSAPWH